MSKEVKGRRMTRDDITRLIMKMVVLAGIIIFLRSAIVVPLSSLGLPFLLLTVVALAVSSRINIKIPGFKSNVSISDVFVFLAMFMFGWEAGVILGSIETLFSSLRISKKPLTIAFNSAAMACSTFLTGAIVRQSFGPIDQLMERSSLATIVLATCVMALVQFVANSGIVAFVGALRAGLPVWATWRQHYLWTSVSYSAGAMAAAMVAALTPMVGYYSILALTPILGVVYLTYSTYLKNRESAVAQAEQSARHLIELQESEERFHSAFDYAPIGMALVAVDGKWIQVNKSLCEIVGYSEEELIGKQFQLITHPEDLDRFLQEVVKVIDGHTQTSQIEKRYVNKDGQEIWALVSISLIQGTHNTPAALILQIQDITDRKRAEQQLIYEAFHDPLTKLPNRAWFIEQLGIALSRQKRHADRQFAVLFLDLDRFKIINDSLGHMYGDQLLIAISRRLRQCLRTEDMIARLGGDEFTILLTDVKSQEDVVAVAERVQKQVSLPFKLGGFDAFTTASIGIAFSDPEYSKPEDLLRDADTAMYRAKSQGKDCHVIFNQGMHAVAMSTLQIETDLRRAIERKEFLLHYQPIVSLSTGELTGFEALLRWRHPERGMISPADFIPVAEETGLIVPVGQWVLREACLQMRRWRNLYSGTSNLSVSVNLSGKQFAQAGLIEQIVQSLNLSGLDPQGLKLEITESVVMENIDTAIAMLARLRSLGIEVSIDDFGTGYSSLSYLHRLPIDTLKIDRSFVGRMNDNNENREIIRTIILLAQNLGKMVVAEGIEVRDQLEQLRSLGCALGQGYFFSRPLAADAASELIFNHVNWGDNVPAAGQEEMFDRLASLQTM
jgi:diguanylate cyclase (GGDEF)-like protein/PAS domain S-box-containing protein